MKQIVRNTFSVLTKTEKQKAWLLAMADVFISLLDIVFLVALLFVINFYTNATPVNNSTLYPVALFSKHPILLIVVFFLLYSLKNILGLLVVKIQYRFVYRVASRLSKENLFQYLNGPYQHYVNIDSSVLNRKISQQPIEFCHYVLNGMQQVFSQTILIIFSIIAMLIFNAMLFPLLLLILVPPVLLIGLFMKKKLDETRVQGKKTSEISIQHLQEALAGFVESNIYEKKEFFTNRYSRYQEKLNQYLAERHIVLSIPPRLIEVFALFGLLVLVLINHFTSNNNAVELVTIAAFMAAAYKIIPGIVKIMNALSQIKTYAFSAEGFTNYEHAVSSHSTSNNPINSIAFENVSFRYDDKKVLNDFSLKINKGDMVGITGLSGKGKTTIANLLLGFLQQDSGMISINDKVTSTKNRQEYWNSIAYTKQQSFLIHASIEQNITLQENGYDKEKLKQIFSATGIEPLINELPLGSATIITENGKNFSGGQRQRIIFARALYKNADLLILDEPFNELDEASEIQMLKHLKVLAQEGKMIILITHNKTVLSFCNRQMTMDEQP